MLAARRAARGKRRRPDVARFLLDLEPRCFELARVLAEGIWRPGEYRTFWVREPKLRLISAAPFADRVVHHAWVGVAEPHFERRFVAHSYACRRGKGTHRALMRAHELAQRHRYVLRCDIRKFFPTIDHELALAAVARAIADRSFLEVLQHIVNGSNEQTPVHDLFPGDDLLTLSERRRGLPIGNLTSQFLANVLLDRLDHHVMDEEGCGAYVRYCDDFLVFHDDRSRLRALRESIDELLIGLRLRLHERKGGLHGTASPIPFLGFALHGRRRRLLGAAVRRARRRFERLVHERERGHASQERLAASVRSWLAHAAHATPSSLPRITLERAGIGVRG